MNLSSIRDRFVVPRSWLFAILFFSLSLPPSLSHILYDLYYFREMINISRFMQTQKKMRRAKLMRFIIFLLYTTNKYTYKFMLYFLLLFCVKFIPCVGVRLRNEFLKILKSHSKAITWNHLNSHKRRIKEEKNQSLRVCGDKYLSSHGLSNETADYDRLWSL